MFKQALNRNDDPAGIRWINGDLIGFTNEIKNIKAETRKKLIQRPGLRIIFVGQGGFF